MRKIGFIVAALPLFVACNNNKGTEDVQTPLTPFEKGQQLSITSQPLNEYERSSARKVHVREEVDSVTGIQGDLGYVTHLLWDEGDQIDVFVDDDTTTHAGYAYPKSVFTLVSGANTSEGTFHGTMPADGTEYAIMYPHHEATIVEDYTEGTDFPYKVTQFTMPAVQEYRGTEVYEEKAWPTFANGLLPIFGKGNLDEGFVTYPCGGALRFKLWSDKVGGEKVASIRLAARKDENLSGSFMITPNTSGSIVMNMVHKTGGVARHAVVLQMPDGFTMPTTEEEAVWIYFVLPAPLTFIEGFGVYTYTTKVTNPDAPSADPTHIFVTPESVYNKIHIYQNYITTITFGSLDIQGNNGNINGAGWSPTKPNP